MKKIVIVTNIISPYRLPLFNRLHESDDLQLKVVALAEKEENREWQIAKKQIKFDYVVLPGFHKFIWRKELPIHLNWGLTRVLRRYKPDVIIAFNKKYILWNGTTLLSTGTTGGLIGHMKRLVIKGADRYVTYGTKAAEYLEYMGA